MGFSTTTGTQTYQSFASGITLSQLKNNMNYAFMTGGVTTSPQVKPKKEKPKLSLREMLNGLL